MTKPTGNPRGRPKGAINLVSRETRERAASSGLLPHEFLLSVMRGETIGGYVPTFEQRMDAAKAAAPFYAPKLSAVDATVRGKPFEHMSDAELQALIDEETAALAASRVGRLQ